ncbi:hypothetical protein [Algisphaera agarilytica]|uniref:Uncharacterized protein n=1 Tax=Algisphaera agarilytica TaxID=1385975 RepID=A0A7X0HBU4_9BACT|nr:hypothetical protein [Algisphaera agarilytica]MBB6431544.1 hypothetical protein [Algisphaera agarilytica]
MPTKRKDITATFKPMFWDDLDGRTGTAPNIRDRYMTLKADAGAVSRQRDILCQRAVFMCVCLETMECEAVATGKFDAGVYTQMSNALLGLLKALGLERHVKKAGGLKDYIRERQAEAEEVAA